MEESSKMGYNLITWLSSVKFEGKSCGKRSKPPGMQFQEVDVRALGWKTIVVANAKYLSEYSVIIGCKKIDCVNPSGFGSLT